jgi:hypothetical protein
VFCAHLARAALQEIDMSDDTSKLHELKQYVRQKLFPLNGPVRSSRLPSNHYIGIGIGRKNGNPENGFALRFYVRKRLAESEIPPSEFIGGSLYGVETDVAEVRPFGAYVLSSGALPTMKSRVGAGIQFQSQFSQGPLGTLGAVVIDRDGKEYGLGANHVLSRNGSVAKLNKFSIVDTTDPGSVIFRPAPVGANVRFAPLTDGCTVDCAMVEPESDVEFNVAMPPGGPGELTVNVTDPVFGRPAAKFGCATQWTTGVVGDHVADIRVDCGPGLGVITIHDVALVRDANGHDGIASFAAAGDSGSVVYQQDDGGYWSPFGLLVGGPVTEAGPDGNTEDYIAVCRLTAVLAALDKTLYSDAPAIGGGLKLKGFAIP